MSASAAAEGAVARDKGAARHPATLWHTMSLTAWCRLLAAHGLQLKRDRWRELAAVTVTSAGTSFLGMLQQALHGAQLHASRPRYDPVFVLGHWRSGMTHLHELLVQDERFAAPTALECYAPHHCLISERLCPKLLSGWLLRAPVPDGAAPELHRPHEDELGLLALGAPSPMWSLGYPEEGRGRTYLTLQAVSLEELERWQTILWQYLRLVTYRNPGKRLVLKSATHTARLALLARLFPQARFVHIVRDPYVVYTQSVRMWRQLQAASVLRPPGSFNLERYVLQTFRDMYSGFETAVAALPPGRFHQISYEQLVREPLTTLAACYHAIGLGDFERVRPRLASYLEALKGDSFLDEPITTDSKDEVGVAWGPICRPWGYDI